MPTWVDADAGYLHQLHGAWPTETAAYPPMLDTGSWTSPSRGVVSGCVRIKRHTRLLVHEISHKCSPSLEQGSRSEILVRVNQELAQIRKGEWVRGRDTDYYPPHIVLYKGWHFDGVVASAGLSAGWE